jgi:hypothetical protein
MTNPVPPIAQQVRDAGRAVTTAQPPELADALNRFVREFVGPEFVTSSAALRDVDGLATATFASVVHSAGSVPTEGYLPADAAAVVIDAVDALDTTNLRDTYHRVAAAKRLKKQPRDETRAAPSTTVTLGVILALRATTSLDSIAEELERLNADTVGEDRPDMVVVASTGVIQYAVQIPGEGITGDMLPPAKGALAKFIPPWYVVMVLGPSGDFTMNRMLSYLLVHLGIFSPGAKLPNWNEVVSGASKQLITITGYQYDQAGELRPVPREFYNDRYFGPRPFQIEDRVGHVLATVQFIPWQDGGTILLKGKMPMEMFFVYLPKPALKRAGAMKIQDGLISYVLPITREHFKEMLSRFRRQSNMVVRAVEPSWTVKKVADEGSQSPFVARLMISIFKLRDIAELDADARKRFDSAYMIVLTSMGTARDAAKAIIRIWQDHDGRVKNGEIVRLQRNQIHIDQTVDRELGQQTDTFLNGAVRALKQGMQGVTAELQVNIGFLFQKQAGFEAGIATLKATDPGLANYLVEARQWTEVLVGRRNDVEHEGWRLPDVVYTRTAAGVTAAEPSVDGQPVSQYVASILDRLTWFVEDVTAHLLRRRFPREVALTELRPEQRAPDVPERFRITLAAGGEPLWAISFPVGLFDQG